MQKRSWHARGLTSLFTLGGFIIMSVTGLVLYVVPQGRIAYWVDWQLVGLTKEQWGDVHILSSVFFIVAGAFHIYFNWKQLLRYLYDRAAKALTLKKEILLTTAVSLLLVLGGMFRLPPLSFLLDLNAAIKDAWIETPDDEPPVGHAELLSLRVFCSKTDIPVQAAIAALKAGGLSGAAPEARFLDIARENGLSPRDLYRLLRDLEKPRVIESPTIWTPERVEAEFAGTGLGNKTLRQLAEQLGLPETELSSRMAANGIASDLDQPVKQLAETNQTAPLELLKAALIGGYRVQRTD